MGQRLRCLPANCHPRAVPLFPVAGHPQLSPVIQTAVANAQMMATAAQPRERRFAIGRSFFRFGFRLNQPHSLQLVGERFGTLLCGRHPQLFGGLQVRRLSRVDSRQFGFGYADGMEALQQLLGPGAGGMDPVASAWRYPIEYTNPTRRLSTRCFSESPASLSMSRNPKV